jgi:hypothetical protein
MMILTAIHATGQCYRAPTGTISHVQLSRQYFAPGKTYSVNIVDNDTPGHFQPFSPPNTNSTIPYVETSDSYYAGLYYTQDPHVTLSNLNYVDANHLNITIAISADAPTESDGWTLACAGFSLFALPGSVSITPCANTTVPAITNVTPNSFFAGKATSITITGTDFVPNDDPDNCNSSLVAFDGASEIINVSNVVVSDSNTLTVTVTPTAGGSGGQISAHVVNPPLVGTYADGTSSPYTVTVLPSPVISWGNVHLNGQGAQSPSVDVGQPVNLTTNLASQVPVLTHIWTVGGTNIAKFNISQDSMTGSVDPTITSNSELDTYFFLTGKNVPVTYQYCVHVSDGTTPCSAIASGKFAQVRGPVGKITPKFSGWEVVNLPTCPDDPPGSDYFLQLLKAPATGDQCNEDYPAPGILFTGAATSPPPSGGGAIEWIQLIVQDDLTVDGGAPQDTGTGADTLVPYGNMTPKTTEDSPRVILKAGQHTVERNFKAQMFEMWTSTEPDAIMVPLGYLQWHIDGKATNTPPWGVNGASTTMADPFVPASATNGYPTWTVLTQ